jgi:ABC-type antimicrobial peptide transport system permease subunit
LGCRPESVEKFEKVRALGFRNHTMRSPYVIAAAILTIIVVTVSWIPARRAMGVDPMIALR